MAGTYSFYGGTSEGFAPEYGKPIYPSISAKNFGSTLKPQTANQLRETSRVLNTGVGTVEVQMLMPNIQEAIPNEHLKEINRLKKLTGIDLTLHGPLIDPTGFQGEGRWDEMKRIQAEKQIWSSIERAGEFLSPDKNIIVTLHSSNGIPEPETRYFDPKSKKEEVSIIGVVNERTGEIGQIATPKEDYLTEQHKAFSKEGKSKAEMELEKMNKDAWMNRLTQMNIELNRARDVLDSTFVERKLTEEGIKREENEKLKEAMLKLLDLRKKGKKEEYKSALSSLGISGSDFKDNLVNLERADIYIRDAFNSFRELYNQAYFVIQKNGNEKDKEKINEIKKNISSAIDPNQGYIKDYSQLIKFADKLDESLQIMNSFEKIPEFYRPLKEWAIDKSAETFSNVAYKAYDKFGSKAPILAIENPPVGMGISRAEELKALVDESRKKLAEKLVNEENMSRSDAEKEAKKLIGATWDVGHINMLKKYGYSDEELKKQAKIIAPYVNKIHLSDNFGFEHTELPMGMGNVPMKEHLDELKKAHEEKLNEIKQIIETGSWYQHFGETPPLVETLSAFGSSVYSGAGIQWNQASNNFGGYFAGYGNNPDVHHSVYGAGFSGLPIELGGQVNGRGGRFSGTPME